MWTRENRGRYNRDHLRYPSDVTDAEWAHIAPLIAPARHGGRRREVDERHLVNGLMYVLSEVCQWRAIPKDLPARSTIYRYFCDWTRDGTLDRRAGFGCLYSFPRWLSGHLPGLRSAISRVGRDGGRA